uniref:MULE transposase domain-containing protein n=1 Tax=Strigamia maritima TaxID=126957 RepID=T1ILB4_STRMM
MDGTFKIVPHMFYQLFTIFMERDDHVFPIVFALMTGKTRASWFITSNSACFTKCSKSEMLLSLLSGVMKESSIIGFSNYKNLPSVRTVVKKTMALPFLPSEAIVDDYWIDHIGVERMSVNNEKNRTNNAVESFHSRLVARLKDGELPYKVRALKYAINDRNVRGHLLKFDQGLLTISQFLVRLMRSAPSFENRLNAGARRARDPNEEVLVPMGRIRSASNYKWVEMPWVENEIRPTAIRPTYPAPCTRFLGHKNTFALKLMMPYPVFTCKSRIASSRSVDLTTFWRKN